ncbi:hypothetical protein G9A89_000133, partial [Geosiphon pyriformis]
FELYSKATEAGYLDAQYNLAVCYANGEGTTKNSEKAFELYSKAAEAGDLDALYNLAVCYNNGEGTIKNLEKAFELYLKAAEAGHLKAQYNLEFCYATTEAGHLNAQYNLALCNNGEGKMRNSVEFMDIIKAPHANTSLNAMEPQKTLQLMNFLWFYHLPNMGTLELFSRTTKTLLLGHVSSYSFSNRQKPKIYTCIKTGAWGLAS